MEMFIYKFIITIRIKMNKSKLFKTIISFSIAILAGSVMAEEPIILKFSHVVKPTTPKGLGALYFAKKAEELTKGKVKVEVYPNSTLFKDGDELNALKSNKVQMLAPSMAKFGELGIQEFEIFDLPFLFKDTSKLHNLTTGEMGKVLFKKLEPKGYIGLAYWDNGFKSFSSNYKLISPKDFKGKTFRIQDSNILNQQMTLLGGRAFSMKFSEVYTALKTGVIDGTENPISNLYAQKMHEVQKYLTISEHGYLGYSVIVNKDYWEKLPKDIRGQLELAMKDTTEYVNKIAQDKNNADFEAIKKIGKIKITYLSDKEKAVYRKEFQPIYDNMESKYGASYMDAIYKSVE